MTNIKIGIVVSVFNSKVTEELLHAATSRLNAAGLSEENVDIVKVPGAVEIPLIAKMLAKTKQYHAIICLGAVIRGETNHYEYVCQQVSNGCQTVMLEFNIPIIFGVLTTQDAIQVRARIHKGKEAAEAALSMINVLKSIQEKTQAE